MIGTPEGERDRQLNGRGSAFTSQRLKDMWAMNLARFKHNQAGGKEAAGGKASRL